MSGLEIAIMVIGIVCVIFFVCPILVGLVMLYVMTKVVTKMDLNFDQLNKASEPRKDCKDDSARSTKEA